jgi:hypothetical protein
VSTQAAVVWGGAWPVAAKVANDACDQALGPLSPQRCCWRLAAAEEELEEKNEAEGANVVVGITGSPPSRLDCRERMVQLALGSTSSRPFMGTLRQHYRSLAV